MILGALDIGGSKTLAGFVSEQGQVLASVWFPTGTGGCERHVRRCRAELERLAQNEGIALDGMIGVGVALPGVVDIARGALIKSAYPDWNGKPVAAMLRDAFDGLPIAVENDVNACAMGEMRFGWKDHFSDFIWVTVSTGVGGAVVSGGEMLRGAWGAAGELGHIKVEYEHPASCPSCGEVGCLEAHASGLALGRNLERMRLEDPSFDQCLRERGLEACGEACALLAKEGEPHALAAFAETGRYLGRGLGAAVNLLNPEAVIFGGGVAMSLPFLRQAVERELARVVHPNLLPVQLVATKLGYYAALIGAAALL